MFDHITPTVFWPLVVLIWFLVSVVVGLGVGKIIRWCDSEASRFEQRDRVAEMHRRDARNGFKSRQGIR